MAKDLHEAGVAPQHRDRELRPALRPPRRAQLTITVKCKFWFQDGDPATAVDDDEAQELRWAPDEIMKWKADFLSTVSKKLVRISFTFHCTRDWWEELQATTQVRFVETEREARRTTR